MHRLHKVRRSGARQVGGAAVDGRDRVHAAANSVAVVANVATPLPLSAPAPMGDPPSLNVTVPVGMPAELVTVAVRITLWPNVDGSTALLTVGDYGRAAHLIDLMERDGLVGAADGPRPRELLKAPNWLHEIAVGND